MSYKNQNDSELLKSFIIGDNSSLGELYSRYWSKLRSFSKGYLCDTNEAMDIVSDVFSKLIAMSKTDREVKLGHYKNVSSLFYAIVRNSCIDNIRKKRNYVSAEVLNEKEEEEETSRPELNLKDVNLSERERECLEMYLNNIKPKVMAEELQISIHTVKNILQNGKKKILAAYRQGFILQT